VGGNAARSELDKLSDPLKKLVFQNANARQWLEAALNDSSFPSDKVSPAERALFLKKITRWVPILYFPWLASIIEYWFPKGTRFDGLNAHASLSTVG